MPQDPTRIQNRAHQGYCNPNDSGLGVNTPGDQLCKELFFTD